MKRRKQVTMTYFITIMAVICSCNNQAKYIQGEICGIWIIESYYSSGLDDNEWHFKPNILIFEENNGKAILPNDCNGKWDLEITSTLDTIIKIQTLNNSFNGQYRVIYYDWSWLLLKSDRNEMALKRISYAEFERLSNYFPNDTTQ